MLRRYLPGNRVGREPGPERAFTGVFRLPLILSLKSLKAAIEYRAARWQGKRVSANLGRLGSRGKAARWFAGARSGLSEAIADYAQRMPFRAWSPPSEAVLELRAIARRIQALTVERTREKNRLHAVRASRQASEIVAGDLEVELELELPRFRGQSMACGCKPVLV